MSERLSSLLVERTRVFVAERGRSLVMFGPAWERGGGRPPQPRDAVACAALRMPTNSLERLCALYCKRAFGLPLGAAGGADIL